MPPTSSLRRTFASLLVLGAILAVPRPAAADPTTPSPPPPTLMVAGPPAPTAQVATVPAPTAQVATAPPVRPPKTPKRWYGWQLLIAYSVPDAIIATGVGLNAAGKSGGLVTAILGGMLHAAIGPFIHYAHRRDTPVLVGSIVLEILMPLTAIAIARNVVPRCGTNSKPECEALGSLALGTGALVSVASAGIIEVAAFSYEPVPAAKRASSSFGVTPIIGRHELGLNLAGSF